LNPRPADYESAALPLSYLGPHKQDLFPCQRYFRTASIKLPSNYHQTAALTGAEIGTVIGRLTICFAQRAGNDPETLPLAILAILGKNALSFSLTIQKDRAAQQKRETTLKMSLSLSHSFRKFLVLQECASWKWDLTDFLFLWRCSERIYTYRLDTVQREETLCRTT
jgi:hypothetical protein